MSFIKDKKIIKIILTIYYLFILSKSDSYIEPYILISILGIYGSFINKDIKINKVDIIISIILSLFISLSNYQILNIFNFILITLNSYLLFIEIIKLISTISIKKGNDYSRHIFLYSFLIILILDLFVLYFTRFPGTLSPDSINQISQIITNKYTNHHPYFHTLIIKMCLSIGLSIFNNMNSAVMVYSVLSIIIVALSFSYTIDTIYKASNNLKLTIIIGLFYILMPYNIEFSYTMWKDVLFSTSLSLFIVSIYRILKDIGKYNYLVFILGSLGTCLLRSNGYFVYILSIIIFIIMYKDKKKIIITSLSIILLSLILKGPLLNYLNVSKVDTIESLSIPVQQISRVLVDGKEVSKKDVDLLNEVVDISLIPEYYDSGVYDNVKNLIKDVGNIDYLDNHKLDYLKLYLKLGFKYPLSYLNAWIDETKGYINSGYEYFRYGLGVEANDYGISQVINNELLYKLFNGYSFKLFDLPVFRLFLSIGLYTWILLLTFNNSIKHHKKELIYVSIPLLLVILSLLIAAPVYAEFRYMYSIFIGLPFIFSLSLLK